MKTVWEVVTVHVWTNIEIHIGKPEYDFRTIGDRLKEKLTELTALGWTVNQIDLITTPINQQYLIVCQRFVEEDYDTGAADMTLERLI